MPELCRAAGCPWVSEAASALSLRLYRVRALHPQEAHKMWALLRELPARAGLPATPVPHYVPSAVVNAFATGSKQEASIALTDGLLRSLSPRELAGVFAHEVAPALGWTVGHQQREEVRHVA